MTTASPATGISSEFIDQIRAKLSRTTVEHYINGRWTEGARGESFETLDPSTNRVMRVWLDTKGERHYVPEGTRRAS